MKLFILVAFVISTACAAGLRSEAKSDHEVRYLNPTPAVDNTPMSERKYRNMDPRSPFGSESRITGGNFAWDTLLPYQASVTVSLGDGWFGLCGGTLIGHEWVVTAAHCVDANLQYIEIGLGSIYRNNPLKKTYASVIYFLGWDSSNLNGDFAILKVGWVDYNNKISPAVLPARNGQYSSYVNERVTASGWGAINDNGDGSNDLKYTVLSVVPNKVCSDTYGPDAGNAGKICVATSGSSTCSGDSGGPLVLENTHLLIGVVSFGAAAGCTLGYPTGFTRVTSYLDFINDICGISY